MELRDYARILRTRKWLIAVPAIVITLGALAFSFAQTPAYSGVAQLVLTRQDTGLTLLGAPELGSANQSGVDDVQTQVEVIQSRQIAARVVQALSLRSSPESVLSRVTVSAGTGTNVITIQAVDTDPALAAAIANSFAEEYVAWSRDTQRTSIDTAIADVQERLVEAQQEMTALEARSPASGATVADRVSLEVARNTYTTLANKLEELRIAGQLYTGRGSLLATATANPIAIGLGPGRSVAAGLAFGLLVGLGIAFTAEQLDTRVRSAQEVADICGAPVLATIPTIKVREAQPLTLALAHRPDSPDAEAYRMLRNSLDFISVRENIKTLLVTSAVAGEGKSTVAANLAAALSQAGKKVMLLGCDFHVPAIERLFELDGKLGVADVLAGTSDLGMAVQQPKDFGSLKVLLSGTTPPHPSELLGSEAMGELVTTLRGSVDWVILDSPPVIAAADAAALARWVDGVLLVARVGKARRDATRAGCDQLTSTGASILGLAVVAPMDSISAYGYYGYRVASQGPS